jgi:hypothetical protein
VSVENGTHKFKAYYLDWESDEVSVTAQNRKNYELFYRKVGVLNDRDLVYLLSGHDFGIKESGRTDAGTYGENGFSFFQQFSD